MSSFSNKGLRSNKLVNDKKVKNHLKGFYGILGDMEDLSTKLDITLDYNEDNINDYVLPLYGRELDHMEKFVLLGKLHYGKESITE